MPQAPAPPYVMCTPVSIDPSALEATAATLESLVGQHVVSRRHDGTVELQDGELCVASSDPDFLVWASVRQGCVTSARKL